MKISTKIKCLEKARDLISDKDNWCQNYASLDEKGHFASPRGKDAVRWCATGAIEKVRHHRTPKGDAYQSLSDELYQDLPTSGNFFIQPCSIEDLNDDNSTGHTHRRVIGVFNRTIKRLKKEQG